MPIELKHKFVSAQADGPDDTVVQPSDWNDDHDLSLAAGKVLGRASGTSGAVQELPLAFDSTMQSMVPPSGTTAQRPSLPVQGMLRFNTTTSQLEVYRNSVWGGLGGSALVASSAPASGAVGDLWFNSATNQLLVYNGTSWIASAVDTVVVTAVGDGVTASYPLGVTPGSKNTTTVHVSGVYQPKSAYTLVGSTLIFDFPPALASNIEIMVATASSIMVPANSSVTTEKIADRAVTAPKLAGSGSTAGQTIVSSGPTTAPVWSDPYNIAFSTRAAFVTWASGKTPPVGTVINAGDFDYRYLGSGTTISDLPGWVPHGPAYPDHWAQNVTPGTTDMYAAMMAAMAYDGYVLLTDDIYAVSNTVAWNNGTLIGRGMTGTGRSEIRGLSSVPLTSGAIAPGRSSGVHNLVVAYAPGVVTGSETRGQRVGLDCRGAGLGLQRGSVIDRVRFENVGTAISDFGDGEFSVTFGTMEIFSHSYRAVDIYGQQRTGSVWTNLYINGNDTYTPEGGFCVTGQSTGGMVGQLNVEHQAYTGYAVRIEGQQGLSINSLHIEGTDCTTPNLGYVGLESSSITVHSFNMLNQRMSADGTAVIHLRDAGYQSVVLPSPHIYISDFSVLKIGTLHLKGLADPNGPKYPSYPSGRRGVRNCPGFAVFKRDPAYTDRNYFVEVDDYLRVAYDAQGADVPFLEAPSIDYTGSIQFRRFAGRTQGLAPYENYVVNGAFDKWVTSTGSLTGSGSAISLEVPNKWNIRTSTGQITVDRMQEDYGAESQYFARVTVNSAGTFQAFDQNIAFPVEWLDANLRLTFEMKAAVAGQVFEQVTATLQNPSGTPTTVFDQVIVGSNSRVFATTEWKRYSFDFTGPASAGLTLGADAVMRLQFQFNSGSAIRAPTVSFRKVMLTKRDGEKLVRHPYDRLALAADDLTDVAVSAPTQGQVLVRGASEFQNLTALSFMLGPFYINDAPATATTQATLGYYNTATALSRAGNDVRMDLAGRVVGLIITSDDARTAGTATVRVRVAGTGTTFNSGAVVLDATNTTSDSAFVPFAQGVAFAAGQNVGVDVVTSGWGPTTANFSVWAVVMLTPF